jgi:hypothetical protein
VALPDPEPAAAAAPAASPSPTASRGGWGAHRQPLQRKESMGKGPEEPRPEPKGDPGNPHAAKLIQDKVWSDLNQFFDLTVKHVAKKETEAANPQLGKSKKKDKAEAAETEGQLKLISDEISFADLFVKPPKLAELDKLLAEKNITTNPLSVYFDLPKTMGDIPKDAIAEPGRHWLFRMRNAQTKLDAQQVIREIDDTIKQLGSDIHEMESQIDAPVTDAQRALLLDVIGRLKSMEERITEERYSPLMDLKARCNDLVKALPDELPSIPQDKYLALVALEEMGIDVDPHQDPKETPKLVAQANNMRKVHDLLRREMMAGNSWQAIHAAASDDDKKVLEEYRELRLVGIKQKVREETGVMINLVDGKDGKKLYYFTTDGNDAERQARYRQANYLLSTIVFSMGSTDRSLMTVFGYAPTTLETLAVQQIMDQADQATA